MQQIEQRTCDSIKQIFVEANKYLDAFLAGEKRKIKENLTLIQFSTESNVFDTMEGIDTMKNVRKRADGRYEYRKMINGELIDIIKPTITEIKQELKNRQIKKKQPFIVGCFKEYVEKWYKTFKGEKLAKKTKEEYHNTLDNNILKKFGDKKLWQLNSEEIQSFINSLENKPGVQKKVFQHFKAILKYLYAQNLIKIDIEKLLVLNKSVLDEQEEDKKPLTLVEQKKLLTLIKSESIEFQLFIIFSLVIGSRKSETLMFKLEHIDENNNLKIFGTKTKRALRTIKISQELKTLLQTNNIEPNEKYFKSDYLAKKANKLLKQINKDLSLHCLRKTCSTNMHYLGIPDKIRQQVLGHASITTTNNIYTCLEYDVKKEDIINLYNKLYYTY